MIVCQHCQQEIIRPGPPTIAVVSHGICVACFAQHFADVDAQPLPCLAADALDRLPMGAILLDENLRVVGYNENELRTTGLRREKVLGRKFFSEFTPCMGGAAVGLWCAERVNGEVVEQRDLDWVLELRDGKRLALLSLFAGRGRVALTITLSPLETGTRPL